MPSLCDRMVSSPPGALSPGAEPATRYVETLANLSNGSAFVCHSHLATQSNLAGHRAHVGTICFHLLRWQLAHSLSYSRFTGRSALGNADRPTRHSEGRR